ncbi:MAG: hypothetical protein K2L25_04095 [Alphaproteobacteria bacterium]|nr:hypothetical protein [Alphaproteobacteria bacterium]
MTEAQKLFQSIRPPFYDFILDQTALWEDLDHKAVEIHKQFPKDMAIDIMIPGWRDWLITPQDRVSEDIKEKHQAILDGYEKELSRISEALNLPNLSHDQQLDICAKAMEAAIHYHARQVELILQSKSPEALKNAKTKIQQQIIRDFETNRKTILCGEILIKIAMYGDFLFRNNAHTQDVENTLPLNATTQKDLTCLKWQIVKLHKSLYGIINQDKSKNNSRKNQEIAKQLWMESGKERSLTEAIRLKAELETRGIKRSEKTIFSWICMW